jgi:hypothetical protein
VESQALLILVIAAIVILGGVALWAYLARQRTERLRQRFGPEYERAIQTARTPAEAEAMLHNRASRVDRFKLHPLSPEQAEAFSDQWRRLQARFVDDPDGAVTEADTLVAQVMTARGYPPEDFDRRAEDVSVDHPNVAANYRTARTLLERRQRGEAGTEELRRAVVNYRALFDDLLETRAGGQRRAS